MIPITVDGMAGRDEVAAALRPPLSYRLTAGQWLAIDCLAATVAAGALLFDVGALHGFRWHAPTEASAVYAVAVLTVAARRIWPVPVLVVVTGAGCLLTAAGRAPLIVDATLGMALYMAAVLCRRATAVAIIIAAEVVFGALFLLADEIRWMLACERATHQSRPPPSSIQRISSASRNSVATAGVL